ncbi:lipase family protein [Carbonactinospora thermoautotrophica]|uniref:lipase family protein n=1 Tax=Carbonactinospora thermoautotrophica TaxID=1469144 RepID=UPI0018E32A8B|nr:lipase family protein [Carbonactinospora thermoautotrophica]
MTEVDVVAGTARPGRGAAKTAPDRKSRADRSVTTTEDAGPAGRGPEVREVPDLKWETRLRSMLEIGGLWTRDVKAPTYEELRPKPFHDHPVSPGFPIHKNLQEKLLEVEKHPDPTVAHVLATCSAYAYSGAETVSMIMARTGLEDNHCRMISASADGMLICSTSFLIQSEDGKVVILCYRGTEPASFINWLTGVDVEPERINYQFGDPCASVHGGFYRNVRATRYEVMGALGRALEGKSVRKPFDGEPDPQIGELEALYITGHSLGGAMAALMAVMLKHEQKYKAIGDKLRAVYTFGQPMIEVPRFAKACEEHPFLRENVIRYIYDSDVVPYLPPATSGPFKHFGREFHYRIPHVRQEVLSWLRYLGCAYQPRKGHWEPKKRPTRQMPSALGIALGGLAFAGRKSQLLRSLPIVYSFEDHLPHHYMVALTPPGLPNEFGD